MRLLCDQHVARKYRQAFEQEHWVTCATVREMLAPDAQDIDIAGFAGENNWIVFTNDDDFHGPNVPHGLVIYSQVEDPRPSDVSGRLRNRRRVRRRDRYRRARSRRMDLTLSPAETLLSTSLSGG